MKQLIISFGLICLLSNKGFSQYDSLVVYHRTFCADYGKVNNDIDRIKDFAIVKKFVLKDKRRIEEIISMLKKLKSYKGNLDKMSEGYLLGGYVYKDGKEELLFTISTYKRLTYANRVRSYKDKFLDFLFGEKPPCYYP